MLENQFVPSKLAIKFIKISPNIVLNQLKYFSGKLATEFISTMVHKLKFLVDLNVSQKTTIQLFVQTTVVKFVEWIQQIEIDNINYVIQTYKMMPQSLRRHITLNRLVDIANISIELLEEAINNLVCTKEQINNLNAAILHYGKKIAFSMASLCAGYVEVHTVWDSWTESKIVDAIIHGKVGVSLQSQAVALGWNISDSATVVIGLPRSGRLNLIRNDIREVVTKNNRTVLSDIYRNWLVAIISGELSKNDIIINNLLSVFADGPIVIGPNSSTLMLAHYSATEAAFGMFAVPGWPNAPRPVTAHHLLPERALLGDTTAITALKNEVVRPLSGTKRIALAETLDVFLDSGGAIEVCARKLFVHPNTVRYRIKKIVDYTGRNPYLPRDAYILRIAFTLSRITKKVLIPTYLGYILNK